MSSADLSWDYEKLYFSGDDYFEAVWQALREAKSSIMVECYILNADPIGRKLIDELSAASQRGVKVRLLVDGLGSLQWLGSNGKGAVVQNWTRIYHPLRLAFFKWGFWRRLNRRLHRKQVLIDDSRAFVGSYNFSANHSRKFTDSPPEWQDVAVEVRGSGVVGLQSLFLRTWRRSVSLHPKRSLRRVVRSRFWRQKVLRSSLYRSNDSIRQRFYWRREILHRLRSAKHRIWIANPYFLPERRIMSGLTRIPSWRRETKVIVPLRSDVFLVRLAIITLFHRLLRKGLQIYEFQPTFFHGKIMIIDDWIVVGSTNLNHRSILHDLELDIVLTRPESKAVLVREWFQWMRQSKPVDQNRLRQLKLWERLLGRFFVLFKWWL
jgi:cardiolipin synthase